MVTYNSHVFRLKDDLKSLQQNLIYDKIGENPLDASKLSHHYRITPEKNNENKTYHDMVCDSWESVKEVANDIAENLDDKDKQQQILIIQYSECLSQLSYELVYSHGIVPHISLDGCMVSNLRLHLKIDKTNFNDIVAISSVDKSELMDSHDIAFAELAKEAIPKYARICNEQYVEFYRDCQSQACLKI